MLPKESVIEELADKWRPYRSLGSYFMWRVFPEPKAAAPKGKKTASKGKTAAPETVAARDLAPGI